MSGRESVYACFAFFLLFVCVVVAAWGFVGVFVSFSVFSSCAAKLSNES